MQVSECFFLVLSHPVILDKAPLSGCCFNSDFLLPSDRAVWMHLPVCWICQWCTDIAMAVCLCMLQFRCRQSSGSCLRQTWPIVVRNMQVSLVLTCMKEMFDALFVMWMVASHNHRWYNCTDIDYTCYFGIMLISLNRNPTLQTTIKVYRIDNRYSE